MLTSDDASSTKMKEVLAQMNNASVKAELTSSENIHTAKNMKLDRTKSESTEKPMPQLLEKFSEKGKRKSEILEAGDVAEFETNLLKPTIPPAPSFDKLIFNPPTATLAKVETNHLKHNKPPAPILDKSLLNPPAAKLAEIETNHFKANISPAPILDQSLLNQPPARKPLPFKAELLNSNKTLKKVTETPKVVSTPATQAESYDYLKSALDARMQFLSKLNFLKQILATYQTKIDLFLEI